MLPGSGFMIILVMVLLRRIKKKMVGEKKKKKRPWTQSKHCQESGPDGQ